jgi:hypothetical protein
MGLNSLLGYPPALQMPGGHLFVAHYGDDTGLTYFIGSSFDLP